MRSYLQNEPLLIEAIQVSEDGTYCLNWPAFLKSLERQDDLYFRYTLQFQVAGHAAGRSGWAHIKTLRSVLTYNIFQLKERLTPLAETNLRNCFKARQKDDMMAKQHLINLTKCPMAAEAIP